jgi:UDP-N-acetylmuramyl pentapeptide phosphotransferase/UDP-N-acetylglucosamine-1-phosphate transferase
MIINFFLCIIFSYFLTNLLIPIFKKKLWGSFPNQRTSHSGFVPLGGSLGFISVSSIIFFLNKDYYICLFLILSLMGLVDDLKSLSNKLRLVIQIIIGIIFSILVYENSIFNYLNINSIFFGEIVLITFMTFLFVSIINFTNFADGLDGLLSGSMIIIFLFGAYILDINYIFLVGGLIGFLILNWYPAKVFMGDSGSYFLGSIYCSSIFLTNSWTDFLALLLIGSPLYLDVMLCVVRRYIFKQNIFKPHKLNLYQRLNQNGINHWQISLIYMSSKMAIGLSFIFGNIYYMLFTAFIIFTIGIYLDLCVAVSFKKGIKLN